ncbi:hypothetical protein BGX28_007496 [Mortierella sp. GBA30]|nr:hypothetical protein BGX28_007496 [Mortierella sp. GBA30]
MSNTPSIFDLPLIVDLICQHLTRQDYFLCALVSKTFYQQSKRHLWRELSFVDVSEEYIVTQDHQDALLAHAHWIRELHISEAYAPVCVLARPVSACTNLSYLKCNFLHEQNAKAFPILTLLERNPRLRHLEISTVHGDAHNLVRGLPQNIEAFTSLLKVLKGHPSLETLSVKTVDRLCHKDLPLLLLNLPESLQSFTMATRDYNDFEDEEDEEDEEDVEEEQELEYDWPDVYPRLKELDFSYWEGGNPKPFMFPLLSRCPLLEKLQLYRLYGDDLAQIVTFVRKHCPRFKDIEIDGAFTEDELLPLVDISRAMESLSLYCSFVSTSIFISQLTQKWCSTLTSVSMGNHCTLLSHDIQLLLSSCSQLTLVSVQCSGALRLSDLVQSKWTCLGLKKLRITFQDERVEQETLEQHWEQEARTRDWIKETYAQLGRLKRLRHLTIRWEGAFRGNVTGQTIGRSLPVAHLDMSMASGLGLLHDLRNIETVWLMLTRVSMGPEELEWILLSWPKLAFIGGLDKGAPEWLNARKPGLEAYTHSVPSL